MSQAWEKLIETEDGALTDCLSLARVSIDRKTGNLTVRFHATRLLSRAEYKLIASRIAGALPMVKANTKVSYPALRDRVIQDLSVAAGLLKELVRHESPASMPFID